MDFIIHVRYRVFRLPIHGVVVGLPMLYALLQVSCRLVTPTLPFVLCRILQSLNVLLVVKLPTRTPDVMPGNMIHPLFQITETRFLLGHLDQEHFL